MSMLNLSSVYTDSYLLDTFGVVRRTETVGDNGRAVVTLAAPALHQGVVYTEGANLQQEANSQRQIGRLGIISSFQLIGEVTNGGDPPVGFQPDIIQWLGNNYIVKSVSNYGNLGGYCQASCELYDIALIGGA